MNAAVSGILLSSHAAEMEEWCVAAIYAAEQPRSAALAGVDKALRRVAEEGTLGDVRREMMRKTLRAMRGEPDRQQPGVRGRGRLLREHRVGRVHVVWV
ncbi:hypothetical protein ZWY2020_017628 [Hordeum vulgare]|nr:hypothetical protein ZWY2020_017628 [Hordeum vulgare]